MVKFENIIGHERIKKYFSHLIEQDNLSPSYLFYGPEGVGKSTLALEIAKAYNCESTEIRPCGECPTCRKFSKLIHPDLVVLYPSRPENLRALAIDQGKLKPDKFDPTKNITIDQVRELQLELTKAPFMAKKRFVLFLYADNLTVEAQNALLKTLEEPPDNTIFILISSNIGKILPTIRSRCRLVKFSSLKFEEFRQYPFTTQYPLPLLYRLSDGSIGRAQKLLESEFLPIRIDILNALAEKDAASFTEALRNRIFSRDQLQDFLKIYMSIVRDLLLAKSNSENLLVNVDLKTLIKAVAKKLSYRDIERLINNGYEAENYAGRFLNTESIMLSLAEIFIF